MTREELDGTLALQIQESEADTGKGLMDFEQDELLKALKLEQWFPTADPSIPAWCH